VLEQVEANIWKEFSVDADANGDCYYPRFELLKRIKAARATKDDKALEVFQHQISSRSRESCRKLRNENVAELDAGTPQSLSQIPRAATPCSTTSGSASLEDSHEVRGALIDSGSPLQGSSARNMALPTQGGLPLSQPFEEVLPTHRYTTKLYEYGASSGKSPKYGKEWVSSDIWRYEAVLMAFMG